MGRRDYLGEFELVVLLTVKRLGRGAYGGSIHRDILERTGRDVSIPAVYVTLRRMESKGLVESEMATPDEGGRAIRSYTIRPTGESALARSRELMLRLWDGLSEAVGEGGAP